MQLRPAGDNAILLELGDVAATALHGTARAVRRLPGVRACIVGHASLYVIFDGAPDVAALARLDGETLDEAESRQHTLRVQFDGEDFDAFLAFARMDAEAFYERVAHLALRARYLGFRGGFAYLDGWPAEWAMPRRPTSRQVLRGTFAVAGSMAGFYPIDSPGGWNLLGHTDAGLEHAIAAGDGVTIQPVRDLLARAATRPRTSRLVLTAAEVLQAPLATVVRAPDWEGTSRGIPPGGPYDEIAASIAAESVEGDVELIECAMAAPRLRMKRPATVGWCDPQLRLIVRDLDRNEEFAPGRVEGGLRGYIAIGRRRGIAGNRFGRGDRLIIEAAAGPHDAAVPDAIECEVTPQLDRVGIRLHPTHPIRCAIPASMPSCGMQFGTVQLHPDGSLVAMGPEHPVTGGYPQPMTVLTTERWKLAQLMPGERVTFRVLRARQSPN